MTLQPRHFPREEPVLDETSLTGDGPVADDMANDTRITANTPVAVEDANDRNMAEGGDIVTPAASTARTGGRSDTPSTPKAHSIRKPLVINPVFTILKHLTAEERGRHETLHNEAVFGPSPSTSTSSSMHDTWESTTVATALTTPSRHSCDVETYTQSQEHEGMLLLNVHFGQGHDYVYQAPAVPQAPNMLPCSTRRGHPTEQPWSLCTNGSTTLGTTLVRGCYHRETPRRLTRTGGLKSRSFLQ